MRDINILKNNGVATDASIDQLGGIEAYDDTINTFLELSGVQLRNLKSYKDAGDIENYTILVHSIKSEAKILGFSQLADMAYLHELSAKKRNADYISYNFANLEKEFNRVIQLVRTYTGVHNDLEAKPAELKPKENKDYAILVTDDSEIIRNYISKIVNSDWKYEAVEAKDGFEAINIINKNPKIVGLLLDLNMPNLSGDKVLKYLKDNYLFEKISVAVITGEEDLNKVKETFDYPIIDTIQKDKLDKNTVTRVIKTIDYRLADTATKSKAA